MQKIVKALNECSLVTIADKSGKILSASQPFCDACGYSETELLGKNHDLFSMDSYDAVFWSNILQTILQGKVWSGESKNRAKNGRAFWLSSVINPIVDEDQQIVKFLAVHQDVTERKNAETELLLSREKYQSLVMNIPGITYRCKMDADWTMLFLSKQIDSITGYNADEIIQSNEYSYGKLIHPEDQQLVIDAVEKGASENAPWEIEYRVRHKDGSIRWVYEKGRAVMNDANEVEYLDGFILDITDRKSIEQENIRQKENLLRIGQLAKVGGWNYDVVEDRLSWTQVTYDIHELPYHFIPDPKTAIQFYKEGHHRDTIKQSFEAALQHGKHYDLEVIIVTASGKERWVRSIGEATVMNGQVVMVSGVFQDIDQRKRTDLALDAERTRLASIIEGTHVGTWEWNMRTGEVAFNERWANMIGYTLDEISPVSINTWLQFAHPEDLEKSNYQKDLHLKGELPLYSSESRMRHKNGDWIWVLSRGKVITWTDDGEPLMMFGTHLDISERKKIEKEKEYQMALLKALFEESTVGIALIDMETGAFLDANGKMLEPTGYTKEEILALTYWDLTPKEYFTLEQNALAEMKEKGFYSSWEKECIRKDGSRYPIRLNGVVVDGLNGKNCIWSIVEDITEFRIAEETLVKAKEQAIAGSKAKSEFLANMSHEIRTPLNGVIGFNELLKTTSLTAEQQQYVDSANVSAHALLSIISDILDFSKIEAGMLHLELLKIDIISVIEESIDMVKFQAAKKNLELLLDIDATLPRFAVTDPIRLKQVLTNLLSNAVKFTEKGEVALQVIYESLEPNKGKISFFVRDTGIGITDEQMEKLFKAFSQADSSTTRKFGGTGLGLIISDLIVKKFGGKIELHSRWGEGTTFHFTIITETENPGHSSSPRFDQIKRCLIIDDNQNSCRILKEMLSIHEIASEICHDGLSALKLLETATPFDIIFCDYQMPYFSGIETIRMMRDEMKLSAEKQPVILLHSLVEDAPLHEMCNQLDVRYRLTKPIKQNDIHTTLQQMNSVVSTAVESTPSVHHGTTVTSQKSVKILIAEDIRTNMLLLKLLIEKMHASVQVIEAKNGHETVRLAREVLPDLIFMDVQMPDMDGLVATQMIRSMNNGANVPIIALTAGAFKEDMQKCIEAGMNEFLTKPIEKDKIQAVLLKYLPLKDEM